MTYIILYLVQIIFSFWLLQKSWRYSYDLETHDVILFGIISLIPIAFLASILIWVMEKPWSGKPNKVWRKKY